MPISPPLSPGSSTWWSRHGPIVTLLLISPVLSELLSGSTHLSTIFVLIPSTGFWGCAAILIRELAVRRGNRWSLLLLGIALALLEEGVVQQTSLAPLIGVPADHAYGRWYGVNWVYLLWAVGFESVWAVIGPVLLTEALFPDRRSQPWLGRRGVVINMAVMAAAAFLAWFMWTQVFLPKFYPTLHYHPAVVTIAITAVLIVGLIALATIRSPATGDARFSAPAPWMIAAFTVIVGLPWFLIIMLAFNAVPALAPQIPLAAGVVAAGSSAFLFARWSSAPNWSDRQRCAVVSALIVVTLAGGIITLRAAHASPLDRAAHVLFNVAALAGIVVAVIKRRLTSPTK